MEGIEGGANDVIIISKIKEKNKFSGGDFRVSYMYIIAVNKDILIFSLPIDFLLMSLRFNKDVKQYIKPD